MKKNILKVTLIALFAGYNVYSIQKSNVMSDLGLANVEALVSSREFIPDCENGCLSS